MVGDGDEVEIEPSSSFGLTKGGGSQNLISSMKTWNGRQFEREGSVVVVAVVPIISYCLS